MKALLLKGPGQLVFEDIPVPKISNDEVLVEVKYCGICGSDVHCLADCRLYPAGTYLGHEFSGVLAKVGKNVRGWEVGDRVVINPMYRCGDCYACKHGLFSLCEIAFPHTIGNAVGLEHAGAFAKYVRVPIPEKRLHRLPKEVSFEEGALVEPLSCSLHAVRISAFRPGDYVMVLGAGTIGLGDITFLNKAGAGLIIATEVNEKRAELANKFGADYVFNPYKVSDLREEVLKLTNGVGVDVVFDCSGVPQAFQSATSFLRKKGQIMLHGIITNDTPILPMDFTVNEWCLQGSIGYYSEEFPMVIQFLKKGVLPAKEMITSKIKLNDIVEQGFNELLKPDHGEIKIIVELD